MSLDFVPSVLVSMLLTGALSALAYRRDVLTWDGSLAAFVVGMVIGIFGDVTWLFLLLFSFSRASSRPAIDSPSRRRWESKKGSAASGSRRTCSRTDLPRWP